VPAQNKRDPTRVFVVYGRNTQAYDAMVRFLQSLRLDPRDFMEIRNELQGAPFIGNIVRTGMERAQAIVVMFTPDEFTSLRPSLVRGHDSQADRERWQARPNVLLEAGMALALDERRTIPVVIGNVELPSDLDGRHVIRLNNSPPARAALKDALRAVGCDLEESGRWFDVPFAGDFETCLQPPGAPTVQTRSPFERDQPRGRPRSSQVAAQTRSGGLFSGPADLTVLPCSTAATVARSVQKLAQDNGIAFPARGELGDVKLAEVSGPASRRVAWAYSVSEHSSTPQAIRRIGSLLGRMTSQWRDIRAVEVPLLGAGAGGLTLRDSVQNLYDGFQEAAVDGSIVIFCTLDQSDTDAVRGILNSPE
jgi:hypothetical protein